MLAYVEHVSRDYGTPAVQCIGAIRVSEARALHAAGQFPAGSMGPKVEAACAYTEATGHPALVTDMAHLAPALEGAEGTRIVAG